MTALHILCAVCGIALVWIGVTIICDVLRFRAERKRREELWSMEFARGLTAKPFVEWDKSRRSERSGR